MKVSKEIIKEYVVAFIQAVLIFLIMYLIFWPVKIDGISMEPELLNGDRVAMSRVLVYFGSFQKGDIVICKNPSPGGVGHVVKRIIGEPGDSLLIKDGELYINGELSEESYAEGKTYGDVDIDLSQNEYFIMGDNRESSVDSRNYGKISKSKIQGKVILRWFPINKIKRY